jgi:hypothetical protein
MATSPIDRLIFAQVRMRRQLRIPRAPLRRLHARIRTQLREPRAPPRRRRAWSRRLRPTTICNGSLQA